jgi:hypothetical protein
MKYITPSLIAKQGALTTWQTIVWLRPIPVFTSILTLYYLGWLYALWLRNQSSELVVSRGKL